MKSTAHFHMRLSEAELDALHGRAGELEVSVSEYVRSCVPELRDTVRRGPPRCLDELLALHAQLPTGRTFQFDFYALSRDKGFSDETIRAALLTAWRDGAVDVLGWRIGGEWVLAAGRTPPKRLNDIGYTVTVRKEA